MRPSLQNAYNVSPTTSYDSKQVTSQHRFKRWGNRLHHLMEGATKKLWSYLMYHRKLLAHINGTHKRALSIAVSKCSQCITRNLFKFSLSACFALCRLYSQGSFALIVTKWLPTTVNLHPHNVPTPELLFPIVSTKFQELNSLAQCGSHDHPWQEESTHCLNKPLSRTYSATGRWDQST